tara:strand:+ start:255 stop:443 length:189 start_codon:yes stop_codon:yes gene_type:complete
MNMIQVTVWLNPEDETWFKGKYITTLEWMLIEKERISKAINKRVVIETDEQGYKAIFREKLR